MAERYVDAALNGTTAANEAYFFLAGHFVAYHWGNDRVVNGVRPVSEWMLPLGFARSSPDLKTVDAILKGKAPFLGKAYFFSAASYARYDLAGAMMETPDPPSIAAWNFPLAFRNDLSAGFNGRFSREGKGYVFKGDRYIRFQWSNTTPVDQGYPKPISTMIGMPASFASGFDAAVDGGGAFSDLSYLFKDEFYLRFDWNSSGGEPHVDGAPTLIRSAWNGLAELLLAGKAKAQALLWLAEAITQLTAYIAFLGGVPFLFNLARMESALATHFHLDASLPAFTKLPTAIQILTGLNNVVATLNRSASIFRYRSDAEAVADGMPAIDAAYTFFNGSINFTRNYVTRGPLNRAASALHESVHFFDDQSGRPDTHIPEWYLTDAAADSLGLPRRSNIASLATRYDLMTTATALHNPACYASFAQHIFYGSDTRFGEGHHDL